MSNQTSTRTARSASAIFCDAAASSRAWLRNTALRAGSDTAGRQGPHRVDGLGQEMCRLGERGFAGHSRGRTGQRSRCGRCIRSREPVSRSFRYPPRGAMYAACSSFRVILVYALPLGNQQGVGPRSLLAASPVPMPNARPSPAMDATDQARCECCPQVAPGGCLTAAADPVTL